MVSNSYWDAGVEEIYMLQKRDFKEKQKDDLLRNLNKSLFSL